VGGVPDAGHGLAEIGPEHPEYGKWLAVAEDGGDPQPEENRK
jgi:hypothetical protein